MTHVRVTGEWHNVGDVWVLDAERGSADDEWMLLPEVDKTKK